MSKSVTVYSFFDPATFPLMFRSFAEQIFFRLHPRSEWEYFYRRPAIIGNADSGKWVVVFKRTRN